MVTALLLHIAEPRAKKIAAFASRPENWYRLGETTEIPGDRPEFVLMSGTIRAVFTWTRTPEDEVFRHMSIGILGSNLPNPTIVWTVAHMFGFTGAKIEEGLVHEPAQNWMVGLDLQDRCIVVQEKILDFSGTGS